MPKQLQTLTQEEIAQDSALIDRLALASGGMSNLACELMVSRQTLYDWKSKGLPPQIHRLVFLSFAIGEGAK